MAFPEDWGPPPQFAALRVTAEGVPLSIHTEPHTGAVESEEKKLNSSAAAPEEYLNQGSGDDEKAAVFFAVKGCPTASNDMLVKKGEYEGGFSIWECTWDLLGFLQKEEKAKAKQVRVLLTSGHVLDLGCGHGLLGIWALKSGASAVVFQDLNKDVLNLATRWNILKNTENDRVGVALQQQHELSVPIHAAVPSPSAAELGATGAASASVDVMGNPTQDEGNAQKKGGGSFTLLHGRALCVAASWEEYPKICCSCQCARTKAPAEMKASENTKTNSEEQIEMVAESNGLTAPAATPDSATETLRQSKAREIQYSLIFCSEGTYREETFEPLAEIFKRLLHKDGIALIASKRYYFGIGGGSLAFISFLREKYADSLSVEVAASYRGVNSNNFRDVLLIRNKGKPEE